MSTEVGQSTLNRRVWLRTEHAKRSNTLTALAFGLFTAGQITETEAELLYRQAEEEWDDAIHIAAPDDPLRSLCGHYGRNLADLPAKPDPWEGCWGCLQRTKEALNA